MALHKNIKKYLSNIGKKGGKAHAEKNKDRLSDIGRMGGLKKAENWRKANPWFSTDKEKED